MSRLGFAIAVAAVWWLVRALDRPSVPPRPMPKPMSKMRAALWVYSVAAVLLVIGLLTDGVTLHH